ncbi:hypothetical protein DPMN_039543 [Dreissena polymorpha]|uniref:Uncharacterized protein n=1 Tax=Dreissena polymorpha TaxID=45954 RepID=A0A9D4HUG9_DREPO|nr:hypothetical protein DPMN_039543 [Dreissena polymorpha]
MHRTWKHVPTGTHSVSSRGASRNAALGMLRITLNRRSLKDQQKDLRDYRVKQERKTRAKGSQCVF